MGSTWSSYPWCVVSIEAPFKFPIPSSPLQFTFPPPIPFLGAGSDECRRVAATTFISAGALFPASPLHTRVRVMRFLFEDKTMQQSPSKRPPHHADDSQSLFQNPWTLVDSTQSTSTSTYWPPFPAGLNLSTFLTNPNISLERVRNSDIHPHPPVKVVRPDWGHSTSTATSFERPGWDTRCVAADAAALLP